MLGFIERKRSRLKRSRMRRRIQDAGFWFVDIPRTGSTSLKQALGELYGEAFGKRYCRELDARAGDTFFPDHTRAYVVRDLVRQKYGRSCLLSRSFAIRSSAFIPCTSIGAQGENWLPWILNNTAICSKRHSTVIPTLPFMRSNITYPWPTI